VDDDEVIEQFIPSIVTVFSLVVVEKSVPVIVIEVPPAVVPLAGLIFVTVGVLSYLYSTISAIMILSVFTPFTVIKTGHYKDVISVTLVFKYLYP